MEDPRSQKLSGEQVVVQLKTELHCYIDMLYGGLEFCPLLQRIYCLLSVVAVWSEPLVKLENSCLAIPK